MTMAPGDHIIAPSRGTVDDVEDQTENAHRLDDCREYIRYVYDLCAFDDFPDASIVIAQSVVETSDPHPWQSRWWTTRLNPAGLGITGDPRQDAVSRVFLDGEASARGHVSHLLVYAIGPADAGSLWHQRTGGNIAEDDPRYTAYLQAYGNVAKAETIAGLSGTWATDSRYAEKIVARGNAVYPNLPNQSGDEPVAGIPTILVDAGHRSTDRTGNPAETDLTDDMARAYVDELRRRGFKADWLQRDVDKDNDADDVVGDLDTVGRYMRAWGEQTPGDLLLISCHYNGAHSPLHAIVPDNRNLSTRVVGGDPTDDTAANNILDCKTGEAMVQLMASRGLGGLFHGKLGRPGLMSETETGVGLDGFRLAVMAYTAVHRQRMARLILEHGGTADPAARRFADFARAAADGIETVYGKAGTTTTTTTAAPKPPSDYADPITTWMGDDTDGHRTDHVWKTTIDGTPTTVAISALERPYEALRATPRYQGPDTKGKRVGPKLDVRERFVGSYVSVVGKGRWVVTKNGSWLLANALTPRTSVRRA